MRRAQSTMAGRCALLVAGCLALGTAGAQAERGVAPSGETQEGVWLGTLRCDPIQGTTAALEVDFALRIDADGRAEYRAGTDVRRRNTGEGEERGNGKLSRDGYLVLDGGARGVLWTQAAYYTGAFQPDRVALAGSQTLRLRDGVDSHRRGCRVELRRSS